MVHLSPLQADLLVQAENARHLQLSWDIRMQQQEQQ
jgi:hypothetical protein